MRWTRKKKVFLIVVGVVLLVLAADYCRVQISLSRIVDRVTPGASLEAIEAKVGRATDQGYWSGSHGSGVTLTYRRPYVWEHVPASLPTEVGFSPFRMTFSDAWYMDHSPEITIAFDRQGRLAEVRKRGFASKSSQVMKSSRH